MAEAGALIADTAIFARAGPADRSHRRAHAGHGLCAGTGGERRLRFVPLRFVSGALIRDADVEAVVIASHERTRNVLQGSGTANVAACGGLPS
jgi:hypothetical protein